MIRECVLRMSEDMAAGASILVVVSLSLLSENILHTDPRNVCVAVLLLSVVLVALIKYRIIDCSVVGLLSAVLAEKRLYALTACFSSRAVSFAFIRLIGTSKKTVVKFVEIHSVENRLAQLAGLLTTDSAARLI